MTNFVPVSQAQHAAKGWRRPAGFAHAAAEAVVPLVGAEFGKAATAMPIAFVAQAGGYQPVALMSPITGRNLFIGPAGQWLGGYVPASLRAYPFRLARANEAEQAILCIDEDSGLVADADGAAQSFFDADGKPSPATKTALDFLVAIERSRISTDLAVAALAEAGLIQPWLIKVNADVTAQPLNGLFRVDELALNNLSDEAFLKLRKSSALPLAYMQLLSTGQVALFEQLIRMQHQLAPRQERQFSLKEIFAAAESETIRFD
jgi:signal transduction histidine kinase